MSTQLLQRYGTLTEFKLIPGHGKDFHFSPYALCYCFQHTDSLNMRPKRQVAHESENLAP